MLNAEETVQDLLEALAVARQQLRTLGGDENCEDEIQLSVLDYIRRAQDIGYDFLDEQ